MNKSTLHLHFFIRCAISQMRKFIRNMCIMSKMFCGLHQSMVAALDSMSASSPVPLQDIFWLRQCPPAWHKTTTKRIAAYILVLWRTRRSLFDVACFGTGTNIQLSAKSHCHSVHVTTIKNNLFYNFNFESCFKFNIHWVWVPKRHRKAFFIICLRCF